MAGLFLIMTLEKVLLLEYKKTNTSHGNEVLPQDTMHLIQRPCYQQGRPCQDPAGNRTTRRPPDNCRDANCSGMVMSPDHHVWPKPSYNKYKTQWKGEEDKADRGRGGKTTSMKWTGLEFAKSQRAAENREKWWKQVAKSSVVPQRPSQLRDRWDERWEKVLWCRADRTMRSYTSDVVLTI